MAVYVNECAYFVQVFYGSPIVYNMWLSQFLASYEPEIERVMDRFGSELRRRSTSVSTHASNSIQNVIASRVNADSNTNNDNIVNGVHSSSNDTYADSREISFDDSDWQTISELDALASRTTETIQTVSSNNNNNSANSNADSQQALLHALTRETLQTWWPFSAQTKRD